MHGFTLGRKLDVNYPTNRWVIIITLVLMLGVWLQRGSMLAGVQVGLGFFLCWALAREVDPAHDFSAFLATAFYLLSLLSFDGLELSLLFSLLLLLRSISGVCGRATTLVDQGVLFGFTAYLLVFRDSGVYPALLSLGLYLALLRDNVHPPARAMGRVLALISILASVLWPWQAGIAVQHASLFHGFIGIFVLGISLTHCVALTTDTGMHDDMGKPLMTYRVQRSHAFYTVALLALLLWENLSLATYILLISVLLGTGIYRALVSGVGRAS